MAVFLRLIVVSVVVVMTSGCTGIFFFPEKRWYQTPDNQSLAWEDVFLQRDDAPDLHGWWLPAEGRARGTVYFLHGNAQNVSTHLMNVRWLPGQGFNVFLLDYRGYGKSEGAARMPGALEDVQYGLDWLVESGRAEDTPLILFGQSLGGALGGRVAAESHNHGKLDCVLLEAAFAGFPRITRDVMSQSWLLWPFQWPMSLLVPGRWDLEPVIGDMPVPLLVMHSRDDQIIPPEHGQRLYEKAPEPREFLELRGPHIAAAEDQEVRQAMLDFITAQCGVHNGDL